MLCTSCRNTLLKRIQTSTKPSSSSIRASITALPSQQRNIATAPTTNSPPANPPPSTTSTTTPPAATSQPGTAQPFSNPFFPSSSTPAVVNTEPSAHPLTPAAPKSTTPSRSNPVTFTSTVPGGTPLPTLVYTKPTQTSKPLLALEDSEYPSWLWTLIPNPKSSSSDHQGGVDVTTMTKKMRAKYERKMAKIQAGMEKPVPVHEQSRDLSATDGGESRREREELRVSMRNARRKEIREANFLRSM